jgi:hypothetical protein
MELIMTNETITRFFSKKILIAFTALSLSGAGLVQSASAATNTHETPSQQGNDYNFLAGGGG